MEENIFYYNDFANRITVFNILNKACWRNYIIILVDVKFSLKVYHREFPEELGVSN